MFGAVLNRLATSVRRALSDYSVGNQEPNLALDFVNNKYITNSSSKNFSNAVTHSRSGNATMTDGYGPELVTNGGFDSDSDWTKGTGWTISGGRAVASSVGSSVSLYQASLDFIADVVYEISFEVKDYQSGSIRPALEGSNGTNVSSNGFHKQYISAPASNARLFLTSTNSSTTLTIDNVSVREMPVLKWAPHNLVKYSEEFDNSVHIRTQTTVTANSITAPNGTQTADTLVVNATNNTTFRIYQDITLDANADYTYCVYLKKKDKDWAWLELRPKTTSPNQYQAFFNLATGAKGTVDSGATSEIEDVGDGWYKCSITAPSGSGANADLVLIGMSEADNDETFVGVLGEGMYIWGAHLYRSDLGGMVDNPERGDSYVPTAIRPTGSNLITNGTFDTDTTGWAGLLGASLSVVNGALRVAEDGNDASTARAYQAFSTVVGKAYEVKVDYVGGTSDFGEVYINNNTNFGGAIASDASIVAGTTSTLSFVATATTTYILLGAGPASEYSDYDNVSVRESTVRPDTARYLPRIGHHVYNGSAWVNEGLLAESEARTNLYDNNDSMHTNGAQNSTTSANGGTAPDGTDNAFKLLETTATGEHTVLMAQSVITTGKTYTCSVFVKSIGGRNAKFGFTGVNFPSATRINFDLQNLTTASPSNSTIQEIGNGWYRLSVTDTSNATGTRGDTNAILQSLSGTTSSFAGDTSKGLLFYGMQIEEGATPSSYIPTANTTTVTRASETFTIPSANLPWPSPNYIGSELVTNGTFDTDSDWTLPTGFSISSGVMSYDGTGTSFIYAVQAISTTSGKVYAINFDTLAVGGSVAFGVYNDTNLLKVIDTTGSTTVFFVASGSTTNIIFKVQYQPTQTFTIDNVSVREINPLSVSIAMDGRMTFADTDDANEGLAYRWFDDLQNRIQVFLSTASANTGQMIFYQEENDVADSVQTATDYYEAGILTPFSIASRHGSTFVNGANEGVALTANTTPTALADLSSIDMRIAFIYMGTVGTFRVWDKDIGDTGLVEATNPSLEPSLSLTFEGTGTNSFVVNDWSE